MSEPRILGPTDRATILKSLDAGHRGYLGIRRDLLALLDTCDAMANVIRRLNDGWTADLDRQMWWRPWSPTRRGQPTDEPMSPAEAAVLDTTRQDPT